MNYVFCFLVLTGTLFFGIRHNMADLMLLITQTTADCGSFVIKLLFLTSFFSGIIKIGEDSGILKRLSALLHPILTKLFTTKNQAALQKISLNISANMLGIGNAATPPGLAAMKELDRDNPHPAVPSRDMCRFVLCNTCSVQLIPTTVIALRAAYGSRAPSLVVLPVLIVSITALLVGLLLCRLLVPKEGSRS